MQSLATRGTSAKLLYARVDSAKMQSMFDWNDVRVFLALARLGSYSAAARELRVNGTTVARRLAALERALDSQLFERTPTALQLSRAGALLQVHAERVERELLESERRLRGADARLQGELVVTAGDGITTYLLVPWLAEFRSEHPGLRFQLRSDNRALDLRRREADIALRLFRPKEKSLIARRVARMPFGVYASEGYLARTRGAALAEHDWLEWDEQLAHTEQARWRAQMVPSARVRLRVNTTVALVAACALGHGVAVLPSFAAEAEPRLLPLAIKPSPPSRELWLVTHADARKNIRVRTAASWLSARFARQFHA